MELITLKAKAPIKALQIPQRNLKPCTKRAANPKIIPLTTKENKPKVIKVIGKARKDKIGCSRAFKTPNTIAAITPFFTLSISTPVGNLEIISRLIVVTIKEIRIERILFI